MIQLPNITALQVDTVDPVRAREAERYCTEQIEFAETRVLSELTDFLPAETVDSYESYNRFIVKYLYRYFGTDFVLVYQHDGFIVNPKAWSDEFLKYDYIGSVIWNGVVGCGGFSLRSKRFCEASAALSFDTRKAIIPNEDFFLCMEKRKELESQGMKFAPVEVADKFAWNINAGRQPKYTGAFGFHSPESLEHLQKTGVVS